VFVHGFTGHPKKTWVWHRHRREELTEQPIRYEQDNKPLRGKRASKFQKALQYFRGSKTRRRSSMTATLNTESGQTSQTACENVGDVFWPADLVPETVPRSRVLTYGYDTHIRHVFQGPINNSSVSDYAWDMLVCLESQRRDPKEQSRPILFVVHSLGGIVVKHALWKSRNCILTHPHLHAIFESTVGVFFFGTPHRGADPRNLVHNIVSTGAKILGWQVNQQIVDTLCLGSERMTELREQFLVMCHERKWRIWSFQEAHSLPLLGKEVVEASSSCLEDPMVETKQRINRNHMDMCRFFGLDDPEYEKVASALQWVLRDLEVNITNDTQPSQDATQPKDMDRTGYQLLVGTEQLQQGFQAELKKKLVTLLSFSTMEYRRINLPPAHEKSCQWFYDTPQYKSWCNPAKLTEHGGILWVRGNPGTGKSILMNFLFKNACEEAKLNPLQIVLSFFFFAQGEVEEKSSTGLYRSLLYQLFHFEPDIIDESLMWMGDGAQSILTQGWQLVPLQQTLVEAIKRLGGRSLTVFIDALDECMHNEIHPMIRFFTSKLCPTAQSNNVSLRICLSSRHYPQIRISRCLELVLEDENGHTHDIEHYIDSALDLENDKTDLLKKDILKKSNRIFLWVVLVIEILNEEYPGKPVEAMREKLKDIPGELSTLFTTILGEDRDRRLSAVCFKILLCALRPLTPEELYFAVHFSEQEKWTGRWDQANISLKEITAFVRHASKGLAEVSTLNHENARVQFIHESVRDFLLGKDNDHLWLQAIGDFKIDGDELLKNCCLKQLRSVDDQFVRAISNEASRIRNDGRETWRKLQEKIHKNYPFLDYSANYILHHANFAQRHVDQATFLKVDFPLSQWLRIYNTLHQSADVIYPETEPVELSVIFAEMHLANLLRISPPDGSCFEDRHPYGSLICLAVRRGGRGIDLDDTILALLEIETRTRQLPVDIRALSEKHTSEYRGGCDLGTREGVRKKGIVSVAAIVGLELVIAFIIALNNCQQSQPQVNLKDQHDLDKAAFVNSMRFPVDQQDDNGRTPLSYACEGGYKGIVRLLLDSGAAIDCTDARGRTPLCYAAKRGHEELVKLLLKRFTASNSTLDRSRALINAKDLEGMTPLSYACRGGYEKVTRLLLDHGAVIDCTDGEGRTPLSYAVEYGHKDVVELLLQRSRAMNSVAEIGWSHVNIKDYRGRTPLTYACLRNSEELVRLLLQGGATVNILDADGRTPLSWAAGRGYEAIVKLLVETGADIDLTLAEPGKHFSPLRFAYEAHELEAEWCSSYELEHYNRVINYLLDNGASPNGVGHAPPIENVEIVAQASSSISNSPHTTVLKLRLQDGNEMYVRYKDSKTITPWHFAVEWGCVDVVRRFIRSGTAVNQELSEIGTALHLATSFNHPVVVECLLDNGADVNARNASGRTALHLAPSPDIARILLENGAEINTKDNYGRTALFCAVIAERKEVVKALLDLGADTEIMDHEGQLVLHASVRVRQEFRILDCLLDGGADIDGKDAHGRTPLKIAVDSGMRLFSLKLLQRGADPNVRDFEGETPFFSAIRKGDTNLVKEMLKAGADAYAQDKDGRTAFWNACVRGPASTAKVMHEWCKNTKALHDRDSHGKTLLHSAVLYDDAESNCSLIQFLVEQGVELDAKDNEGKSALWYAGLKGHVKVIKTLLQLGADIQTLNERDAQGRTVLHAIFLSQRCPRYNHLRILVDKGVDINAMDNEGKTALWYAWKFFPQSYSTVVAGLGVNESFL